MRHESTTEISFAQVRKLVQDELNTDETMESIDAILGAIIAVSPVFLGPVGIALLPLIDAKNELMRLGKIVVKRLTTSEDDYLGRSERMAAANCLIVYTSFFEALSRTLPNLTEAVALTPSETLTLAIQAFRRAGAEQGEKPTKIVDQSIALPHPADDPLTEVLARVLLYRELSKGVLNFMSGLRVWETAAEDYRERVKQALDDLPAVAFDIYLDQYLALATDYPAFLVWTNLYEHAKTRKHITGLSRNVEQQAAMVAGMADSIDRGLSQLDAAIRAVSTTSAAPSVEAVVKGLRLAYADTIAKPVIDDRFTEATEGAQLEYPSKADAFIPQGFKVVRRTLPNQPLENEALWAWRKPQNDLGSFVVRYFESAYGADSLLLVLGHPGSGKSLLTEMLASRLAPGFSTVRVELRDIDTEADLQSQIERQIRSDTGHNVSWPQFAEALSGTPPLIILDGFDELLQSSGKTFSHYLLDVASFQHRERVQRRPVRIMVTSRITLIDKAALPPDTTVLRLLEFDESRRSLWIDQWNDYNERYFSASDVAPFTVPDNPKVLQLAEQPLLLLMLAVYDSASNQLSRAPNIDQTLLYHSLLTRFIERERRKGDFASLSPAEQEKAVTEDLQRLGVAAIGMFNRQALHIQREELDADITYFGLTREVTTGTGRRLSQAELLLGSFFFIHESKSCSSDPDLDATNQPTAFEFLHNTFGEFLAADFILRQVLTQTAAIGKLRADPTLASTFEQRLDVLEDHWFTCLAYTPLHLRPVILGMLREWFTHKARNARRSQQTVLDELDLIIYRQLGNILFGTPPPPLMGLRTDAPYDSLPLLGHLATYTLNLVLLRTVLSTESFTFDESAFGAPEGGCRPWDRLTQLWRSWLPMESLTGVASIIATARTDEEVVLRPGPSFEPRFSRSRLHDVFAVANALGDDVLSFLAGLSVHNGSAEEATIIGSAATRLARDGMDIWRFWTALRSRWDRGDSEHYLDLIDDVLDAPVSEPFAATALEVVERSGISLDLVARMSVDPHYFAERFLHMSRYEATLWIELNNSMDPCWLAEFFATVIAISGNLRGSPGCAPLLRAAAKRTSIPDIGKTVERLSWHDSSGWTENDIFDFEAAAAMAMLAARYGAFELCDAALGAIVEGVIRREWRVVTVPLDYLRCLTTALRSGVPSPRTIERIKSALTEAIAREGFSLGSRTFEFMTEFTLISDGESLIYYFMRLAQQMLEDSDKIGLSEVLVPVARVARKLNQPELLDPFRDLIADREREGNHDRHLPYLELTVQDVDDLGWAMKQLPQSWLSTFIDAALEGD